VEGRGVAPPVEVEDPPLATWRGDDRQLDAALAYLDKKLREAPVPPLEAQTIPQVGTPAGPVR
jgi:tricorn protease